MNPLQKIPTTLALCNLPYAGQQVLAKADNHILRTRLLDSPTTHIDIINMILERSNIELSFGSSINNQALTRTTNLDTLNRCLARRHGGDEKYILRNPLAPVDFLIKKLDDAGWLSILAYINPSTPEEAKRKLTPEQAITLIESGSRRVIDRKIRAFELVSANPWMMETPTIWHRYIQEAIAGQPQANTETLHALQTSKVRKSGLTRHPAYHGNDINTLSVTELLATGSGAAMAHAINKPEFSVEDAGLVLEKHNPETHIVGRIINRYGLGDLYGTEWKGRSLYSVKPLQGAPIEGATWMCPAATHYSPNMKSAYQEAATICETLGNNRNQWETFVTLVTEWHGSVLDAAVAACKL